MNYPTRLTALAMALVALVSCTENTANEPTIPDEPYTPQQMMLTGEIEQLETRVTESGFKSGDQVGVFVSTTNNLTSASGNKLNNALFTYDETSTQFKALSGNEIYWESKDATLSVFAYYPYATNVASVSAMPISVKENQSSASDFYSSDFLTAQVLACPQSNPNVKLTFKHSLSRVNVTIKRGSGFTDDAWANTKALALEGSIVDGTVNLSSGGITTAGTSRTIQFMPTGTSSTSASQFSAIVFPQEKQEDVVFRFKIGNDTYSYSPTTFSAVSGKQYNYSFVINASDTPSMTLEGAVIDGWDDTAVISEQTMKKDSK